MAQPKRISVAQPMLCGREAEYVQECLQTTWISSSGRFISAFEEAFAAFCGANNAIACNNGTSALHLALLGAGIGPGDEVIVPTLTYVACANAVRYCGAIPVFVDCDPQTMNLDARLVANRLTSRTKAIMAVHLYGHPAEMDELTTLASNHSVYVIEDAAEAHGALYRGRTVGTLGHVSAFSFFGNKILTTGEGGMVTTSDPELASRVKMLRGQGVDPERRYWFPILGYNYRMTNVAAAIGLAQMERAQDHIKARHIVRKWYDKHLAGLRPFVRLPYEAEYVRHAFWSYVVILEDHVSWARDAFMEQLDRSGIETRPVFHPLHTLPFYAQSQETFPVAEHLAQRGVSLPTHALLTEEDIVYIADCITRVLNQ
jgi:perosamine synthetase